MSSGKMFCDTTVLWQKMSSYRLQHKTFFSLSSNVDDEKNINVRFHHMKPKMEWLIKKKSLLFIMRLAGWTTNTIYPFASLGQLTAPSCPALTIELPLCQPRSLSNLCNLNAVPQLIHAIERGFMCMCESRHAWVCVRTNLVTFWI